MGWNRRIYVATTSLGVYYTEDFTDPAVQPTWTAVNTGLPTLDCKEFWLDPFEPENRQYVLLNTGRTLYMRTAGGNWTSILTPAQAGTTTGHAGGTCGGFCVDAENAGKIWVTYGSNSFGDTPNGYYAVYSDDYGSSWNNGGTMYTTAFTYWLNSIRASGDYIFARSNLGPGASSVMHYNTPTSGGWNYKNISTSDNATTPLCFNSLSKIAYSSSGVGGVSPSRWLTSVNSSGAQTYLLQQMYPPRLDSMWFSLTNASHERMIRNSVLHVTTDGWSTKSDSGAISPAPVSVAPQAGIDEDSIFVGLTLGTHVIGCLTSETDTTATGIAGANAGSSPYTDSIPNTCGGVCGMGIQSVPNVGGIYSYKVIFE